MISGVGKAGAAGAVPQRRAHGSAPNGEPPPLDPQDLLAENQRLKAELAQLKSHRSPVSFDPDHNRISVQGLKTRDFEICAFEARTEAVDTLLEQTLSLDALLARPGELVLPKLDGLKDTPFEVDSFKLKLPGRTLARSAQAIGRDAMRRQGIKELEVQPMGGDRIRLAGSVRRFLDVPFEVSGKLGLEGNKVRFSLEKAHIFGGLPVPRLVVELFSALTGKDLQEMHVQQRGQDFLIDTGVFIPKNFKMALTRIGTEAGQLVLEGGKPAPPPEPKANHNPTTLTME
ncbi:MAG: hypothetical protein AB7S38_35300 [Vulcanimicrobiota bacterium]